MVGHPCTLCTMYVQCKCKQTNREIITNVETAKFSSAKRITIFMWKQLPFGFLK